MATQRQQGGRSPAATARARILAGVGAAFLLASSLTGCLSVHPPDRGPLPDDVIGDSRASTAAPAAFRDRDRLPSCGEVELGQGDEVPTELIACIDDASDRGGELAISRPTVEGDPIISYYRVGPGIDGLEVFTDATRDRYGSGGWTHQLCPDAVTMTEPRSCTTW